MTKLKTLKDLPFANSRNPISQTIKNEIKAEAMKRIKASREEMMAENEATTWDEGYWQGLETGLMDFCNITEEDLK